MPNTQNHLEDLLFEEDQAIFGALPTKQIIPQPNPNHKTNVILILSAAFLLYRLGFQTSVDSGECIRDLTHGFTEFINIELNKDGDFAYYFMVTGQIFVDVQLICFIICQIFKIQNFFISVFIGLFYGVRAMFLVILEQMQNIEKFPYPQNVYWDEPGFPPSLGVPYGITRDFFYSGHTGIMLFSILFWSQKPQTRVLKYIAMAGFPYIILLVISTRVHYVVDVFAGIFFCLWIYRFSRQQLQYFDRFFSKGYYGSICIFGCLQSALISIFKAKRSNQDPSRGGIV